MGIFSNLKQALLRIINTGNTQEPEITSYLPESTPSQLPALSSEVFDIGGVPMTIPQIIFAFGEQKGQIKELTKQNEEISKKNERIQAEIQQFRSGSHKELVKLSKTENQVIGLVKENRLDHQGLVEQIVKLGRSKSRAYAIILGLVNKGELVKEGEIYKIKK